MSGEDQDQAKSGARGAPILASPALGVKHERAMKRNFEIIRALLFYFESKDTSEAIENPQIDCFESRSITYHCRLLYDAGFLRCEPVKSASGDRIIRVIPFELTWDGHEFLDKIRTDTTWNKIRSYSMNKGLVLSFSVITELAKKYTLDAMKGA